MNIESYLEKSGLSQTDFGLLLQPVASQSLVSQWVNGQTRVTLARAINIRDVTKGAVGVEDCFLVSTEQAS